MRLAVGVDVSANRGLDVVVLDEERRLVVPPRRRLEPEELTALLRGLGPTVAVVAIDSPPGPGTEGTTRPCETALRRRGINVFSTPAEQAAFGGAFYDWVRVGMRAFAAARAAGFPLFTGSTPPADHAIEVFPHAVDVCLRGCLPPAGTVRSSSRKLAWRTETLRQAAVPTEALTSLDAVDAALAALAALYAVDGRYEALGEAPHLIVVPASPIERFARQPTSGALRRTAYGEFELDDDRRRVDHEALWSFLSHHAYWGTWRRRADVEAQLASAWRIVAAYERASGRMVGFARAVSDGVALAYLADVYVEPDARGKGLGRAIVEEMIERGPGAEFRWMLHTRDAHGLYQRFGFRPPNDRFLERPEDRGEAAPPTTNRRPPPPPAR